MIAFAGWATLMIAASVLWLLRPLRSAAGSTTARQGASRMALALLVPGAAIALYLRLGNPAAIVPPPIDPNRAAAEQMVERLAARLRDTPDDLRGWRTLARSYAELRRDADAVAVRRRLVDLQPDDGDALVDLAEALATMQGGRFAGDPVRPVQRALALDPDNARALAIAANEAAERNDVAAAIVFWDRLRARAAPGSAVALAVESNLVEARRELDLQATSAATPR